MIFMAYKVVPEPGEKVEAQIDLNLSKKAQPFSFSISDRALYIPRTKVIAKTDPFYFQRVPLDQVRHINVRRLRPYALWILAPIMILIGVITTYAMIEPFVTQEPGVHHVSGWPLALFVGGFVIPY